MKISYNWLKQYIDIDLPAEKLAEILTDIGLEIEGIEEYESIKGGLEGLIIGEVKTAMKHSNADKLTVTTVDIGREELLSIVCGAPNVKAGQKVVVATVGTTLYSNDDSFKIKKTKIRGKVSEGMICAADEIGIGNSHDGIMVLDNDTPVGTPAKEYFKIETDTVFEIGLTPNRIDGGSHIGVARDLAAFFQHKHYIGDTDFLKENTAPPRLIKPMNEKFAVDNTELPIEVIIEDGNLCPRYSGITIKGIEIKESPDWLKNKLKSIGLNPINNIVDITNYILHETGQPLHAFDADKIAGKKIIVKTLPEGTPFITLDEEKRKLSAEDLIICNSEEGMCIAGVFGGIESGISDSTINVFIESAHFNPVSVRKTSKRHLLNTDSAFRFERGTDPNNTIYALKRAVLLMKELAGGTISSEIVDVYPNPLEDYKIDISYENVDRLIGEKIERDVIKQIVTSLEMKITAETDDGISLAVPLYRVDVQREADVIEDILRIYGYNTIEIPAKVKSTIGHSPKPNEDKLRDTISDFLSNTGFNEAISNSLTKSSYYDNLKEYTVDNLVKIFNPLSNDLNVMRQNLLFGGLEAIRYNANRKNQNLKLYELGNCYFYKKLPAKCNVPNPPNNYFEEAHLGLFICGNKAEYNWITPEKSTDFFTLKTYTENVLKRLNFDIELLEISETQNELFEYGLNISFNKKNIVDFGAVSKNITETFDITFDVYYADINWNVILSNLPERPQYKEMPKNPAVRRDLALLLDDEISFRQVKELAYKTEKKILKSVSIFDVYKGKNIETGKKSYAVSFILQDENKTLTDKQIDKTVTKIISTFSKELGTIIR